MKCGQEDGEGSLVTVGNHSSCCGNETWALGIETGQDGSIKGVKSSRCPWDKAEDQDRMLGCRRRAARSQEGIGRGHSLDPVEEVDR